MVIRFLTVYLFFVSLVALGFELPNESPKLSAYRTQILYARVAQVLKYRELALIACGNPLASSLRNALAQNSSDTNGVLELMSLYKKSGEQRECLSYFQKYDGELAKAERKNFRLLEGLAVQTGTPMELFALLDPHCATSTQPGWSGYHDTNPCFAGETLVLARLNLEDINPFLYQFYEAVKAARDGSALNWWDFYQGKDQKEFLALMAFLMSTSTSNSGYVDGFGDVAWQSPLLNGDSPRAALEAYHTQKRQKDLFRDLYEWGLAKKLKFTLFNIDLTLANHHDYMAAYLACTLQMKSLPRALGYAYESKDFVSHLKDNVSVKDSIQNFREDTARYNRASTWGYVLCK